MERSVFVLAALLINALFAGPRKWVALLRLSRIPQYPVAIIRNLERKLNREHRSRGEREMRGTVLVVAVLLLSILAGKIVAYTVAGLPVLELLMLAIALPLRLLWDIASEIRTALKRGDIAAARQTLEATPWRYHAVMDEYAVARAAIEMLAVGFSEKILAAALWYIVFGFPGLFASKSIYLMEETLMQPLAGETGFNKATTIVHTLMHYIPSRLAAMLWLAVMIFLPSIKFKDVIRQIATHFSDATPHYLSVLSAASVLKLSLGGPTSIYAPQRWLGVGTARPTHMDIKRAQYLFALLHLFLFILLGLFG